MNLNATMTMNAAGFIGGLAGARTAMSQVKGHLSELRNNLSGIIGAAVPAAGALLSIGGALEAIKSTIEGVKGSFELGRELEELHLRTGVAYVDLQRLRLGFREAGLD